MLKPALINVFFFFIVCFNAVGQPPKQPIPVFKPVPPQKLKYQTELMSNELAHAIASSFERDQLIALTIDTLYISSLVISINEDGKLDSIRVPNNISPALSKLFPSKKLYKNIKSITPERFSYFPGKNLLITIMFRRMPTKHIPNFDAVIGYAHMFPEDIIENDKPVVLLRPMRVVGFPKRI